MTNSEDTSATDNLSTINSSSKVTDSFSSAGANHQNQLVGSTQKDSCFVDNGNSGGGGGWGDASYNHDLNGEVSIGQRMEESTARSNTVALVHNNVHTESNVKASCLQPTLPFKPISGEIVDYKCDTTEGVLALTNYRLFIQGKDTNFNIPIGIIEQVENRDIFFLHVSGKDARCIRCTFPNNETATESMKKIQSAISSWKTIEDTFAFTFFNAAQGEDVRGQLGMDLAPFPSAKERFDMEIKRMEFNVQGPWRISDENEKYELCGSYPTHIIVPSNMTKKHLEQVACFRSARRFPAVVWRHRGNGAVISRCSQPEVGWFGWRSAEDEDLVQNIVIACADNSKMTSQTSESLIKTDRIRLDDSSDDNSSSETHNGSLLSMELVPEGPNVKKLLILDARSYTTAVANRARGGGCECLEYYPRCEIQFMNLANIHSIRKSFTNVRQLCSMSSDQTNWYSQLESCKWLQHMSGLMKAACTVVSAIEEEGRPVMVHCSDGWDRTPQIVALAEILLDPYYRSLEGFQVLVEREWLDFGHKFADRCGQPLEKLGSEDANERCPVFLQWLDCLHQIIRQFPTAFEFNLTFLVKLAQHTYSNLFGTFLCNTSKERQLCGLERLTHSVWRFLRAPANASKFRNNLYLNCDKVLRPSCEVRDLMLWSQVYLGYENPPSHTTEILNPSQESSPAPSVAADCELNDRMNACKTLNKSKTRSCEDLHLPNLGGLQRRQSDPNLSDSFHAENSCDESVEESSVPLKTSTPRKKRVGDEVQRLKNITTDSNQSVQRLIDFDDSENDDTEPNSESKSESTVISVSQIDPKSIESSTDTLVADGVVGLVDGNDPVNRALRADRRLKTDPTEQSERNDLRQEGKTECVNSNGISDNVAVKRPLDGIDLTSTIVASEEALKAKHAFGHENILGEIENGITVQNLPVHCEVCATSRKLLGDALHSSYHGNGSSSNNNLTSSTSVTSPSNGIIAAGSGNGSKFSSYNTPMHSRTPSTGVPATPDDNGMHMKMDKPFLDMALASSCAPSRSVFDVDGLSSLHDEVQNRLNSIVSGYKCQVEILQRELQLTRDALMKQVCHKCTHHSDRPDDVASVGDSLASGEHQSVGHDSQSSEISWEAVDEKDTRPPLWLPDYAVSNCMGCEASFWLGRRKHHCRSCGKIFCADCSDRTITIPSEQFFSPVRVCLACFQRLASHSSENVPGPLSSVPNGNHASNTNDDLSLQNNSHSRNVQYAYQNGCDHSKHGCSTPASGTQSCSCVTNVLLKEENHSNQIESSFQRRGSATSNGMSSDNGFGSEENSNFVQCYLNHANLPRNPSKQPYPNDISTHATTKRD